MKTTTEFACWSTFFWRGGKAKAGLGSESSRNLAKHLSNKLAPFPLHCSRMYFCHSRAEKEGKTKYDKIAFAEISLHARRKSFFFFAQNRPEIDRLKERKKFSLNLAKSLKRVSLSLSLSLSPPFVWQREADAKSG